MIILKVDDPADKTHTLEDRILYMFYPSTYLVNIKLLRFTAHWTIYFNPISVILLLSICLLAIKSYINSHLPKFLFLTQSLLPGKCNHSLRHHRLTYTHVQTPRISCFALIKYPVARVLFLWTFPGIDLHKIPAIQSSHLVFPHKPFTRFVPAISSEYIVNAYVFIHN